MTIKQIAALRLCRRLSKIAFATQQTTTVVRRILSMGEACEAIDSQESDPVKREWFAAWYAVRAGIDRKTMVSFARGHRDGSKAVLVTP